MQEKQKEEESDKEDDDAMSAISAVTGDDRDVWGGSKRATRSGSSNLQLGINMNNDKSYKNECIKRWFDEFILDSGTAFSMLANRKLAEKMFKSENPIDMHTNLGHEVLSYEAKVPGFGNMHLHDEGLANIFGLDDLIQKGYRVVFDSEIENAFAVHGKRKS